jgi:hypothetical protein
MVPMMDTRWVSMNSTKNTSEIAQQQISRNRAWARFENEGTIQTQLRE